MSINDWWTVASSAFAVANLACVLVLRRMALKRSALNADIDEKIAEMRVMVETRYGERLALFEIARLASTGHEDCGAFRRTVFELVAKALGPLGGRPS